MKHILSKEAIYVLQKLNSRGYEAYLVGGAVRDALMGTVGTDVDVTTSALPEETIEVFRGDRVIETGLKHGTVTVMVDRIPVEITTYRVDGAYSDGRHPDKVNFTRNLREDLMRRDFTINAMAMDVDGNVVDYYGGREDLEAGIIRAVGDPEQRFGEDALRILRGMRFISKIGFTVETETDKAMRKLAHTIMLLSVERIYKELVGILTGRYVGSALREYSDILSLIIPEIADAVGLDQRNPHHDYDVYEHIVRAVEAVPSDKILRLSTLFHDLGKPSCFTVDHMGIGHMHGHSEISAEIADRVMRWLKADNATRDEVVRLVRHHDIPIDSDKRILKRRLMRFGEDTLRRLIEVKRADVKAQAESFIGERLAVLDSVELLLDDVISEGECFSMKDLAIDGNVLVKLGYRGRVIGEILRRVLEAVVDGEIPNTESEILGYIQTIKNPCQSDEHLI